MCHDYSGKHSTWAEIACSDNVLAGRRASIRAWATGASGQICAWAQRIRSNFWKAILLQLEREARCLQQAASLVGRLLCLRTGGALPCISCLACRDMWRCHEVKEPSLGAVLAEVHR